MININFKNNFELYTDYENCLNFLKNNNFSYKDIPTFYHLYSEIKTEKELLCVESFFATQNYTKNKLIIWSDYDISNKKRSKESFAFYEDTDENKLFREITFLNRFYVFKKTEPNLKEIKNKYYGKGVSAFTPKQL